MSKAALEERTGAPKKERKRREQKRKSPHRRYSPKFLNFFAPRYVYEEKGGAGGKKEKKKKGKKGEKKGKEEKREGQNTCG